MDKTVHRFKRKLVGQALSERSMHLFEPVVSGQLDVFVRCLDQSARSGQPVNMALQVTRLAYDIVSLLAFGQPLHTQTAEKYREFLNSTLR